MQKRVIAFDHNEGRWISFYQSPRGLKKLHIDKKFDTKNDAIRFIKERFKKPVYEKKLKRNLAYSDISQKVKDQYKIDRAFRKEKLNEDEKFKLAVLIDKTGDYKRQKYNTLVKATKRYKKYTEYVKIPADYYIQANPESSYKGLFFMGGETYDTIVKVVKAIKNPDRIELEIEGYSGILGIQDFNTVDTLEQAIKKNIIIKSDKVIEGHRVVDGKIKLKGKIW
jgi:hypothetical protein